MACAFPGAVMMFSKPSRSINLDHLLTTLSASRNVSCRSRVPRLVSINRSLSYFAGDQRNIIEDSNLFRLKKGSRRVPVSGKPQCRCFWSASAAAVFGSGVFLGTLYSLQTKLIYFPFKEMEEKPEDYGLTVEDRWITTEDGVKIHSWLLGLKEGGCGATVDAEQRTLSDVDSSNILLFFHGNAGNISHRLQNAKLLLENLRDSGQPHLADSKQRWKIMLLSYRGYGLSEGKPNKDGLQLDARAAFLHLSESKHKDAKLFVFGRSLGGAVALSLAADIARNTNKYSNKHTVDGYIIENTFTSIRDMVDTHYSFLALFKFLITENWDNINSVLDIRKAVAEKPELNTKDILKSNQNFLMISGRNDEIVPPHMMDKLHMKMGGDSSIRCMKIDYDRGDHNSTWLEPGYFKELSIWIDEQIV